METLSALVSSSTQLIGLAGLGKSAQDMYDCCLWIVILGFVFAFIMAMVTGANDCANSFGTSVGSKVLSMRMACGLATVFEILGCVLIGYKVSDTVRKGVFDVTLYSGREKELMLGSLAALLGSACWQGIATFLKMPVSGTHSIIGATLGFTLVARGLVGIMWWTLIRIALSWVVSPILSGLISFLFYFGIRFLILQREHPIQSGLKALPFIYGFTIFVNTFSIIFDGPKLLKLDDLPLWVSLVASLAISAVVCISVRILLVPWLLRRIKAMFGTDSPLSRLADGSTNVGDSSRTCHVTSIFHSIVPEKGASAVANGKAMLPKGPPSVSNGKESNSHVMEIPLLNSLDAKNQNADVPLRAAAAAKSKLETRPEELAVSHIFILLQILTAIFGSFAHGGNDVSNAIGPLIAIWLIYSEGDVNQASETPFFLLLFGGIGISAGLWLWGRKVMETVGTDLTEITPSSGFSIEIGAAFTVLIASKIGLPISTTHCKVGSVVFVGWARSSKKGVSWSLFKNIAIAWIVTVPIAALLSAGIMAVLRAVAL